MEKEESTNDKDAVVCYHLWDSGLTILWDGDVRSPPGVAKAAEVIRDKFALRFWKIKVRKSFFAWFGQRYKVHVPHQNMVAWDGTKYVWTAKDKGKYAHYWRAMWGQTENDKQKSLLATGDCITRAANATYWNW
jgi:hypothetical protein